MKIAALADIHGNYQALISILDHIDRWKPDHVLVLGDIVNRGPRSRECLHLIQEKEKQAGWQIMKGNHEGYVLNFLNPSFLEEGPEFEHRRVIFWTFQSLTAAERQYLNDLPERIILNLDHDLSLRAFHASTAGDRVGIYPDTGDKKLVNLIDPKADLFLVGHTHQPLIRSLGDMIICNVGSVGLPFDGDKRASYAQFTLNNNQWRGNIVRVEYDLSAAAKDYIEFNFIPEGGPLAELVLAELKLGWPQLSDYFQRYEKAVLSGEINLRQAVDDFLLDPHVETIRDDIPMTYP